MKKTKLILVILLILAAIGILTKKSNTSAKRDKKNASSEEHVSKKSSIKDSFEVCNFGGDKFYIIPDMNAADVYLNFENKGFKIDKQIYSGNTSISCELSSSTSKYVVIVTGCSPEEIIVIEATADDYSGNNQNEVENFLGYVTTLQYKNSEPEKARRWLIENIDIDGAKTTIGGVTFSIHFKTSHSKFLRIGIEK